MVSGDPIGGQPHKLASERQELDGLWSQFVIARTEPHGIRREILESWHLCRDRYEIDPSMRRSLLAVSSDELEIKRIDDEVLRISQPFLLEVKRAVVETGSVLTYFDRDCSMLECAGDPKVCEDLREINFCPGGNWKEEVAGTNGPGTALARRQPCQVITSEHFVEAWHKWACYAAPILDPVSGEPLAVIDVTAYKNANAMPHMLLVVNSVARAIQQELACREIRKDYSILDEYVQTAARRPNDGIVALDHRGRILRMSASAERLLRVPHAPRAAESLPELRDLLSSLNAGARAQSRETFEGTYIVGSGQQLRAAAQAVFGENRLIGAVVTLRDDRSAGRRNRNDESCDSDRSAKSCATGKWRTRYCFDDVFGNSPDMQRAIKRARQVAQQELPVLINGESGTGKEMFAQAIHHASARAQHPFIAVNCGSIPRELLEAELFGYVSGAFTGARQGGNAGKFEEADGGTIFLDEVSELPLSGQVALLRVLQEMEITRVGSSSPIRLDVRVIAACNKNLLLEIDAGRFRRDLYYRLNVLAIDLPPLRQREEDIVMLAQVFLAEFSAQAGRGRMFFTPQALDALARYEWPGNIRELRNLVQRAAVLAPDLQIDCETLREIGPCVNHPAEAAQAKEGAGADEVQRKTILEVLSQCSGNVSEASRRLGLSRMTIYRKMRRGSISRSPVLLPISDEKLASGQ
jgi:sigma-54 dependent transcriptional regulator, acetoin dehydrogenase operon transcriptional activator AcoR